MGRENAEVNVSVERELAKKLAIDAAEVARMAAVLAEHLAQQEPPVQYYTILGYLRKTGKDRNDTEAGRMATAYCRKRGVEIRSVPDTRYGTVNSYPEWVLDEVMA